jgi:hypothetical protein
MRAAVLGFTFNLGFWFCIGMVYAMFRAIYWFVKRFRLAQ